MVNLSTRHLQNDIFTCYQRIYNLRTYKDALNFRPDGEIILETSIGFIKEHIKEFNDKYNTLIESNQTMEKFFQMCNHELGRPYALYTIEDIANFSKIVTNAKNSIIESLEQNTNSVVFNDIYKLFDDIDNDIYVLTGSLNTFNNLSIDFETKMVQLFNISRKRFWELVEICFITSEGYKIKTQPFKDFDIIKYPDVKSQTIPETNIVWIFKNSKTNQEIQNELSLRNFVFI